MREPYVFLSTLPPEKTRRSALTQVMQTLFEGSTKEVLAALFDQATLSEAGLKLLSELIEKARQEGRWG